MIPSNPVPQVCNYGTSATYRDLPNEEQLRNGVVPLDSLPAAWWNCMWNMTNGAINCARYAAGVLIDEINTVLTQAGVCVNCGCVDQLYQAIDKIRQTIGTASVAGAVKSSSTASEVAIDPTTGIMSVNCLGNAASLTTTASTVVGAINELKSTYDTCWSNNTTALSGKAPTNHASTANTYGVGSASNYGHLKISDVYNNASCQGTDIAASQKAVYCAWKVASDAAAGNISLGNTAGCALGTASAGTTTTAARSDHVHPKPSRTDLGLGTAAAYNIRTGGNVTYVPYSGTDANCVLTGNFLAYWNGAYSSAGASNLRYYCGGAFGSAAACAATAFLAASGCAADSAKLNGYASDTAATNNTIARRQASGYLYATYFNQSSGAETATSSSCFVYANSDGFFRKTSVATVKSVLGLESAAYCAATAFRASDWWPDSLSYGRVYKACCACCAWGASSADCVDWYKDVLSLKVYMKWCVFCQPFAPAQCIQLAVCGQNNLANVLLFPPPDVFTYGRNPNATQASVSPFLADCICNTKWLLVGPKIQVCCCSFTPSCTVNSCLVPYLRTRVRG